MKKTTHLVHREGDWRKKRRWGRALIHDEQGKEWLYYRVVDKTFHPHLAAGFCRFELSADRLTIARCLSGMRDDVRRLVAEGPPQDELGPDEDE